MGRGSTQISRKIGLVEMTCRSAVDPQMSEFPSSRTTASAVLAGKAKNNFSIDHLLARSDPVIPLSPTSADTNSCRAFGLSVNCEVDTNSPQFGSQCGFTTPDSSCGTYHEDYLDNGSEHPSEDSFDNGNWRIDFEEERNSWCRLLVQSV